MHGGHSGSLAPENVKFVAGQGSTGMKCGFSFPLGGTAEILSGGGDSAIGHTEPDHVAGKRALPFSIIPPDDLRNLVSGRAQACDECGAESSGSHERDGGLARHEGKHIRTLRARTPAGAAAHGILLVWQSRVPQRK